jgi:hypothetical protein
MVTAPSAPAKIDSVLGCTSVLALLLPREAAGDGEDTQAQVSSRTMSAGRGKPGGRMAGDRPSGRPCGWCGG